MATSKRKIGQNPRINQNHVARAIFAAADSVGMTDRKTLEQLTAQVIQQLTPARPLPGWEQLFADPSTQPKATQEEENAVKETSEKMTNVRVKPASIVVANSSSLKLSENALTVLNKRYLKKDSQGNVIETPEEMFRRVAKHVASAEVPYDVDAAYWEEEFYRVMTNLEFLPNSPTLMNAGRELGQLSACFVIPIEDSMESIFDAVKYTALIHKSGGGTGFSFSRIRPEKDRVGSTGGIASGPISFMRAFDTATDVIKQGGMRRGANMAILNVDHPDILKFITAKEDSHALNNFNLSVALTDTFMKAAELDEEYELINPSTRSVAGKLRARDVFNQIVNMAWRTGDPGLIFIDQVNRYNPTPELGRIESTNPCGEQPLLPFESCNLGSVNLNKMLVERNGQYQIDYDKLASTVRLAIRFLDDVIDVNKFPLPQIADMTRATRKVGLGVMGFANVLIQLRIPYNSARALELAENIMRFISQEATKYSSDLARERSSFPAYGKSIYAGPSRPELRNASRTTIAPTGTLSIIAGCSSGIEPLFALSYKRHILEGEELIEVDPLFEEVARNGGFYSNELIKELADGASLKEMDIPDHVKEIFVTAHDVSPEWHVKIQAAFQKFTDSAVSKTVNLPHEATHDDVAKIYMLAYKEGLKGITIYRDRSRESQVLTTGEREKTKESKLEPRSRPKVTTGVTEKINTGCGHIYITVNSDEQGICEVFSSLGKAGGCASAQLEAISRLTSLALRSGVDVGFLVRHLRGIRCPSIAWEDGEAVLSCADAIGNVLQKHVSEETKLVLDRDNHTPKNWAGLCPDCGSGLAYQEGCYICLSCGYTKCS